MIISQSDSFVNGTHLSASMSSGPQCYTNLFKPKLNIRNCYMVSRWRSQIEREGILENQRGWTQANNRRGYLIPPNNRQQYIGCMISVYSEKPPGTHAEFSYGDVLIITETIIQLCMSSGRVGYWRIYNEVEDRVVPGWFVNVQQ